MTTSWVVALLIMQMLPPGSVPAWVIGSLICLLALVGLRIRHQHRIDEGYGHLWLRNIFCLIRPAAAKGVDAADNTTVILDRQAWLGCERSWDYVPRSDLRAIGQLADSVGRDWRTLFTSRFIIQATARRRLLLPLVPLLGSTTWLALRQGGVINFDRPRPWWFLAGWSALGVSTDVWGYRIVVIVAEPGSTV